MKLLTTNEAAEKVGISSRRIVALIQAKKLPAEKMGRDYFIKERDLKLIENSKAGRPSKQKSNDKNTGRNK